MKFLYSLAAGAALAAMAAPAQAIVVTNDYSFTGNLATANDVALFTFTVGTESNVTLRTWSYAGGTNAAGDVIASGGFDPILALFDSSGVRIGQNDDGGSNVAADPNTGRQYDTFLQALLQPGTYTVSVTDFPNFSNTTLSAGFAMPVGNTFSNRTSFYAFDVLNVAAAADVSAGAVPEPGTWAMMLIGFGGIGYSMRKARRVKAIPQAA